MIDWKGISFVIEDRLTVLRFVTVSLSLEGAAEATEITFVPTVIHDFHWIHVRAAFPRSGIPRKFTQRRSAQGKHNVFSYRWFIASEESACLNVTLIICTANSACCVRAHCQIDRETLDSRERAKKSENISPRVCMCVCVCVFFFSLFVWFNLLCVYWREVQYCDLRAEFLCLY